MNLEYLNFCPRLKQLLETGATLNARGQRVPIAGTSTLNNLRVIREILLEIKPRRTLETGMAYGASTLTILATLAETAGEDFQHTAIDPFQSGPMGRGGLIAVDEAGLSGHLRFFEESSALALPALQRQKERFGFIYIDGSHLFEDVFLDVYHGAFLLESGGVMLLDDCTDRHVAKVIRFIGSNYAGCLEPLDLAAYEDPGKPLKKRVGNLLGIRQLKGFRKIAEPPRKWDSPLGRF